MTGKHGEYENKDFAAVILAGGLSSRMKSFKPLLPIGELTAIERLVNSVRAAGIDKLIVVTGYSRERLQPVLNGLHVPEAYNERFSEGMLASIQTGMAAARRELPEAVGYFLMPVDCPLIGSDVIKALMERIERDGPFGTGGGDHAAESFYVPVFEGKKGHPLFIPAAYCDEICEYEGDGGLKAITDKYWDRMVRVPVDNEGCLLDMDTPKGYDELLEFWNSGCTRRPLTELAAGRRIFLVRHGETCQHREKIFVGQYDVPLSDSGREQIKAAARSLAAMEPEIRTIYSSDLSRAVESAELMVRVLMEKRQEAASAGLKSYKAGEGDDAGAGNAHNPIEIRTLAALREINLGPWDGLPISRIREQYPEEYRRRGRDIFSFKIGNRAENFYDIQYRAVKALREILKADGSRDIIIVTHSGIIRAIENNLKGRRVDDPWDAVPKGGFTVIG